MNKFLYVFILIIVSSIVLYIDYQNNQKLIQQFDQVSQEIVSDVSLIIADTEQEREQGLSGMVSLGENYGMLFVFDQLGYYKFWMKDMLFPIDIIYLDNTMRIVDIFHRVQPNTYPEIIISHTPAQYVLELNAGEAVNKGFTVGSVLHLKHFIPQ